MPPACTQLSTHVESPNHRLMRKRARNCDRRGSLAASDQSAGKQADRNPAAVNIFSVGAAAWGRVAPSEEPDCDSSSKARPVANEAGRQATPAASPEGLSAASPAAPTAATPDVAPDAESAATPEGASGKAPAVGANLNAESLTALIKHFYMPLLNYCRKNAGSRVLSQESGSDLVQSICREVLEDRRDLTFLGLAAFWRLLVRRACFKISDRVRRINSGKRDAFRELHDMDPNLLWEDNRAGRSESPSQLAIANEVRDLLSCAVEKLPDDQQFLIRSLIFEGRSRDKVAEELSINQGALRTRLSRAMERLWKALD